MKEFKIPLVNETIKNDIQSVLDKYDVEVFLLAGKDGLGVSFCVEVPHNKVKANKTVHKTKVFFDDCLEIFFQPENSSVYYGIELNANGACLDYRVFIHNQEVSQEKQGNHNLFQGLQTQ